MKTEYGDDLIYLVQPTRVDYSHYNPDPIKGIMECTYRTYYLATEKGYGGSIRIQLNRINAERFAVYNGLQLVKDTEIDKLLEPRHSWYGLPTIKVEKIDTTKLDLRVEYQ
jgi:hypothetical protein